MKKLNLEQMEKVNGGDKCSRLMRRAGRRAARGNVKGAARLIEKHERVGCDDV